MDVSACSTDQGWDSDDGGKKATNHDIHMQMILQAISRVLLNARNRQDVDLCKSCYPVNPSGKYKFCHVSEQPAYFSRMLQIMG